MLDGMQVAPPGSTAMQLRSLNIIRTAAGGIEGLGEVLNSTNSTFTRTQVRMSLLDSSGAVVDERTVLVARDLIGPNEISPFRIHFPAPPVSVHSVKIDSLPGDEVDSSRLTVISVTDLYTEPTDSRLIVRGRLSSLAEITNEIKPTFYTVQPGDTLLGIAMKLGVGVDEITANNPDLRADTLQVGTEITVRPAGSGVQLTVVAYDRKRRVVGHRVFDLTSTTQAAGPSQNGAPFEVVLVTFSRDIAESTIIAEVTR